MDCLLDSARRGQALSGVEIIDIHGHLGRTNFCIPGVSAAALVETMDRIGVATSVCSSVQCFGSNPAFGNGEVADATRAYPGRILGYVVLWPDSPEAVRCETERWFAEGFVGVKLHNANGFSYLDAAHAPALAMANERRMPVLLHLWGREDEMAEARELAETYSRASILLAHSGSQHTERYVTLARDLENVHLDLCLSLGRRGLVEQLVAEAGAEKVLWGSDATFLSMTHQFGKVVGAQLSEDEKRQVLGGNARRLLDRIER